MNPIREVPSKMFEGATLKTGEYALLIMYSAGKKAIVGVLVLLQAKKKEKDKK